MQTALDCGEPRNRQDPAREASPALVHEPKRISMPVDRVAADRILAGQLRRSQFTKACSMSSRFGCEQRVHWQSCRPLLTGWSWVTPDLLTRDFLLFVDYIPRVCDQR